jgi:hypothetical protein
MRSTFRFFSSFRFGWSSLVSWRPSLGSVNLALVSLYFFLLWARTAYQALITPYGGLHDRAQAAAAFYLSQLFDLGLGSLITIAHVLAGIKLVVALAFACYLLEFMRSLVTRREADRDTIDVVLILAGIGVLLSAFSALVLGDAALIRVAATQTLLIAGAVAIIVVERHLAVEPRASRVATAAKERERALGLPVGVVSVEPPSARAAAAFARIPEARLRNVIDRG